MKITSTNIKLIGTVGKSLFTENSNCYFYDNKIQVQSVSPINSFFEIETDGSISTPIKMLYKNVQDMFKLARSKQDIEIDIAPSKLKLIVKSNNSKIEMTDFTITKAPKLTQITPLKTLDLQSANQMLQQHMLLLTGQKNIINGVMIKDTKVCSTNTYVVFETTKDQKVSTDDILLPFEICKLMQAFNKMENLDVGFTSDYFFITNDIFTIWFKKNLLELDQKVFAKCDSIISKFQARESLVFEKNSFIGTDLLQAYSPEYVTLIANNGKLNVKFKAKNILYEGEVISKTAIDKTMSFELSLPADELYRILSIISQYQEFTFETSNSRMILFEFGGSNAIIVPEITVTIT